MGRIWGSTLAVAAVTALVGCSTAAPAPKPVATKTATPTPTVLKVSLETTCTLLFGTDLKGAVPTTSDIVTRFAKDPDLSTVTKSELESTIDDLKTAEESAEDPMPQYIDTQVVPLQQLLDALNGGPNTNVSFEEYKAGGIELINQCKPYLIG